MRHEPWSLSVARRHSRSVEYQITECKFDPVPFMIDLFLASFQIARNLEVTKLLVVH
jgi:hypothetical protein